MKRTKKPVGRKRTKKPAIVAKKRTKKPARPTRTKKPARKRVRTSKQLFICDRVKVGNRCWFVGTCPHREPHKPVIKGGSNLCEQGFCSLMGLTVGCIPYKGRN